MRVPRQDERQAQGRGFVQPSRVVRQQDGERGMPAGDATDVVEPACPVVDADQVDDLSAHR